MDLTTVLVILGVIILALIIHGIWTNRREKSKIFKNTNSFIDDSRVEQNTTNIEQPSHTVSSNTDANVNMQEPVIPAQKYHEAVVNVAESASIGTPIKHDITNVVSTFDEAVDVINTENESLSHSNFSEPNEKLAEKEHIIVNKNHIKEQKPIKESKSMINEIENTVDTLSVEEAVDKIKIHVPQKTKVNKEKSLSELSIAELEARIEDEDEGFNTSSPQIREQLANISSKKVDLHTVKLGDSSSTVSNEDISSSTVTENITIEPDNIQMPIEHVDEQNQENNNNEEGLNNQNLSSDSKEDVSDINEDNQNKKLNNDIIMLYIVAPEGRDFTGEDLVNCFEKEGILFGDKQIYHRHIELSRESPILFSVANVQNPGTFNPKTMDDFTTFGIVLFMQLPSAYGQDLTNLRLMITTAKAMATELNGTLLTDQQQPFDQDAEEAYLNKVNIE